MPRIPTSLPLSAFLCLAVVPMTAQAAPSVAEALKLSPVQPGIDYDTPAREEFDECSIKAEKVKGATAWVIRGPNQQMLREFADSNGDNVVDTWSYYRNGLEVYRDVDANHNGKADQYRWFHTDGMRWGVDRDEDGRIDYWKLISPEEAAAEVVEALRTRDAARFRRLLISKDEIEKLGLESEQAKKMAERADRAVETFRKLAAEGWDDDVRFSDFGGIKPGMVPAGSRGATKDIIVYENVWTMVQKGEGHEQLLLGTMVNVTGGCWKLIDGPSESSGESLSAGYFFDTAGRPGGEATLSTSGEVEIAAGSAANEKMQEILANLESLDRKLQTADAKRQAGLNKQRAELLLALANADEDTSGRQQWLKQLADMVSAATQEGTFPDGIDYLAELQETLRERDESDNMLAYFEFHRMFAEYYSVTLAAPDVDYAKAQEQWLKDLEAFVKAYPDTENSVEALRQLAMGYEMAGEIETAVRWYRRILEKFPDHSAAPLSQGAVKRLTSEGKTVSLEGNALSGGKVDLASLRGKVVVIQYWTTSCEVCKRDHAILKELMQKYGGRSLEVIGVNLDYARKDAVEYLKSNRLPWKQLYEPGGFDSRLANEMGIVTVPLVMLIDPQGKVVNNNIQANEIEAELKRMKSDRS